MAKMDEKDDDLRPLLRRVRAPTENLMFLAVLALLIIIAIPLAKFF
jgi:hypothetical protein